MDPRAQAISYHSSIDLDAPVLIAAFKGWNDAGESATFAAGHLIRVWSGEKHASIDPEEFYDFQAVRPHVRLVDGMTREITWPSNDFYAARGAGRDVLILVGTEPSTHWRTFSSLIARVSAENDCSLVITMGALLADVPHSRPVPVTGTAVDPDLIDRLGLERSRYEGPTGIVGVLHDACARFGIPSASLWAAVPHYLSVTPNPKAALALVDKVASLLDVSADTGALRAAAEMYDHKVAEIAEADDDVRAYVRLLEERIDELSEQAIDQSDIPSGDALAEELERYLRDRPEGSD